MRLDHVNMFVYSLSESESFYCQLFNLKVKERGTSSKSGRSFIVIGEPEKFYLCLHEAPKADLPQGLYNHFGIHVEDFDTFVKTVTDKGYKVLYGGVIKWPHSQSLYIEGPNGEEIEICEKFGGGLS